MSHYLLSVMEPAGPMPDPEFLEPIMQAVGEVDRAMRDAGIWVYAGGLHDPVAALLFCAPAGVAFSVIDGRVVVAEGRLTTVDLPVLVERHNRLAAVLAGGG